MTEMSTITHTYGWEVIQPAMHLVNPWQAARQKAWDKVDAEIERQLATGNLYDKPLILELQDAAVDIDSLYYRAAKLHHCRHEWELDGSGGMSFSGGDIIDTTTTNYTCRICGKIERGE